jgi:hypothetical protein
VCSGLTVCTAGYILVRFRGFAAKERAKVELILNKSRLKVGYGKARGPFCKRGTADRRGWGLTDRGRIYAVVGS